MRTRDLNTLADRYRREIELRQKDLALIEGEIAGRERTHFGFVLPFGWNPTEELLSELKNNWPNAPKGILWSTFEATAQEGGEQ